MCGIAGIISQADQTSALSRMLDRLAHRGPDGRGVRNFTRGQWQISLGHQRLSIIDIEGGHQPMSTADERFHLTFNGEIFNYLELGESLRHGGETLRTRSDTEVLLCHLKKAVRDHGSTAIEDALAKLNGMFACALWDQEASALLLARDRFGIKPLYYAPLSDGGIAFASELTALLALSDGLFDRSLNPQAIGDYFFHDYIPPPETIVRGIRKLGLAECLVWKPGEPLRIRSYWNPTLVAPEPTRRDERELSEELRALLRTSVKRQLASNVPVGVFLSGGIDSSVISALAAQETSTLDTFSIRFEEKAFDESPFARQVARAFGTRHHEETLSESKVFSVMGDALGKLDEPLADVSILPTFCVARLARRGVKVCLGGDGGDELWAGYGSYPAHRYARLYGYFPRLAREYLIRPLVGRLPVKEGYQPLEWKAKRFVNRWEREPWRRHLRWLAATDVTDLRVLLKDPGLLPSTLRRNLGPDPRAGLIDGLLKLDLVSYLPGSVLAKVDRATMGNSLEARPPFLDNDVVEFSLRQPASLKLRGKISKYLLKQTARSLLPEPVLERKKMGFSVPISRWIRRELQPGIRAMLTESPLFSEGLLDRGEFSRAFVEHLGFRKDWGKTLWSAYVFHDWLERNRKEVRIP